MISAPPRPLTIIPKLRPEFKPRRLQRSKAMTMAAGFSCRDGLVLCADQQIGTDQYKYYENKVFVTNLAKGCTVIVYAGFPATMNTIVEEFRRRIKDQDKTCEEVRAHLRESLESSIPAKSKERHQMLCGICDASSRMLLRTENREVFLASPWECIGFADSALVRYIAGIFMKLGAPLSMWQAKTLCVYVVAQAKKYGQSVGGPTDIVAISEGGWREEFHHSSTEGLEKEFENAEFALSVLLAILTDARSHKVDSDKAIEEFSKYLKTLSVQLRGHME
jgi:20S proteasome alpha/beta subunit